MVFSLSWKRRWFSGFYPFLLPVCDGFSHQSSLTTPLLWLTFLTGYMLFPTSLLVIHPYASYHPKTSWPKPSRWGLHKLQLSALLAELWDRLRCPFWTHGGKLYPATRSSCQQQFLLCSLPPFCSSCWSCYSPFLSPPRHSGPQLFDQVMVPFFHSAASAEPVW